MGFDLARPKIVPFSFSSYQLLWEFLEGAGGFQRLLQGIPRVAVLQLVALDNSGRARPRGDGCRTRSTRQDDANEMKINGASSIASDAIRYHIGASSTPAEDMQLTHANGRSDGKTRNSGRNLQRVAVRSCPWWPQRGRAPRCPGYNTSSARGWPSSGAIWCQLRQQPGPKRPTNAAIGQPRGGRKPQYRFTLTN